MKKLKMKASKSIAFEEGCNEGLRRGYAVLLVL